MSQSARSATMCSRALAATTTPLRCSEATLLAVTVDQENSISDAATEILLKKQKQNSRRGPESPGLDRGCLTGLRQSRDGACLEEGDSSKTGGLTKVLCVRQAASHLT